MNIHFTLDYELFFGKSSGSVYNCMIAPVDLLLEILDDYGIKTTIYVDVGYIECACRLNADKENISKVIAHLQYLSQEGHDLQLHVHPHWEDAKFVQNQWLFDTSRYRLADFAKEDASCIIARYTSIFDKLNLPGPKAFRAGGWCIQPFDHISEALHENGIILDSTVYSGGYNSSETHFFNFMKCPTLNDWRFNDDPCLAVDHGKFHELPISSISVSALFFWQFVFVMKSGLSIFDSFGDGKAIALPKSRALEMLFLPSRTVASIDGFKAKLLSKYYKQKRTNNSSDLVLIGHPKALSPYSLKKISQFLEKHKHENFITASQWLARSTEA